MVWYVISGVELIRNLMMGRGATSTPQGASEDITNRGMRDGTWQEVQSSSSSSSSVELCTTEGRRMMYMCSILGHMDCHLSIYKWIIYSFIRLFFHKIIHSFYSFGNLWVESRIDYTNRVTSFFNNHDLFLSLFLSVKKPKFQKNLILTYFCLSSYTLIQRCT